MTRQAVVLRASASAGVVLLSTALICLWSFVRGLARKSNSSSAAQGYTDLIGGTPLIEIKCLSEMTGCRILVCCGRCCFGWRDANGCNGVVPLAEVGAMVSHFPAFVKISLPAAQGKCEFLNPGGSIKDRTALQIVDEAEAAGLLRKGDTIYEGREIHMQNTQSHGAYCDDVPL